MRFNVSVERLKADEAVVLEKDQPVVCHAVSKCLMVLHMPDDGEVYSCYHFAGSILSAGMYAFNRMASGCSRSGNVGRLKNTLRHFRKKMPLARSKKGVTYLVGHSATPVVTAFLAAEINTYSGRKPILIAVNDQFVDFVYDPAKKQIIQEQYNTGNDDSWQPGDPCKLISTKVLFNFSGRRLAEILSPTLWVDSDSDEDGANDAEEKSVVAPSAQSLIMR